MRKTGAILHRAMDEYLSYLAIRNRLHLFSVELLHRNTQFTAWGLFDIDKSLLTSIVSSMITYMIILIQLKDSFQH
ncbi:putative gustatory receptor 28b [Chelonus insularis]|uniref:putative gustatory receptor 28b n=1 Tax=Chelonus insularis TaxID=460826 RepID=UPI001589F1B2|nr:putative gustatory receptor 28b [Chelonus insularis]